MTSLSQAKSQSGTLGSEFIIIALNFLKALQRLGEMISNHFWAILDGVIF